MAVVWWKVRRELGRLGLQLKSAVYAVTEPWQQWQHDLHRASRLVIHSGAVIPDRRVAVFLVFQPAGVVESVFQTCAHLASQGYAPLVVSNTSLSNRDLERFKSLSWRVLLRPNFGYDFGGYRDGIWLIEREKLLLEYLLILNDSIWFPVASEETLISTMETHSSDVVGALAAEDRRRLQQAGRARPWFLSSFFILVRRTALEHPGFWAFWRTYRCSNSKLNTIRRGERGFSVAMVSGLGLSLGALLTRARLDDYMASMDVCQAGSALRDMVTLDDTLQSEKKACLAETLRDKVWLARVRALMLCITESQNYLSTAPLLCMEALGASYVKKSRDPQNLAALQCVVDKADSGAIRIKPQVLKEMKKLVDQR